LKKKAKLNGRASELEEASVIAILDMTCPVPLGGLI
jgi:hypothetical protein